MAVSISSLSAFMILAACAFLPLEAAETATQPSAKPDSPQPAWSETALTPPAADGPAAAPKPLKLRIAVNDIYCTDTACSCVHDVATRRYGDLKAKLAEKFKIELDFEYFIDSYQLEDALAAKKFDGVICKPWLAFLQASTHKMEFKRIADLPSPSGEGQLAGIVTVRKDSPVKTLSGLNGKTIVIGQADAYEKHHEGLRLLSGNSVKPSEIIEKASCLESIGLVLDGKADAAIISDYALVADCAVDIAKPDDFRVIATTPKIPLTSVILDMGKVGEQDAIAVQKALLSLTGDDIPRSLGSKKGFTAPSPWTPAPFVDNPSPPPPRDARPAGANFPNAAEPEPNRMERCGKVNLIPRSIPTRRGRAIRARSERPCAVCNQFASQDSISQFIIVSRSRFAYPDAPHREGDRP